MEERHETTVVLAEDHAIVREGIASLCASNGMRILGQCSNGATALQMITNLQPEFAILDLNMPGMTGLAVIRRLRMAGSSAKLLILTISREEAIVREALRAGADGYLLKDGPPRHLWDAIDFVRDGGVYVSPLLRGAGLFVWSDWPAAEDPLVSLSPREMEVLCQLVNGLRAKEIAELLNISPKTVDTYRGSLMRKLNVHDLVGLVKLAIERNLTSASVQR